MLYPYNISLKMIFLKRYKKYFTNRESLIKFYITATNEYYDTKYFILINRRKYGYSICKNTYSYDVFFTEKNKYKIIIYIVNNTKIISYLKLAYYNKSCREIIIRLVNSLAKDNFIYEVCVYKDPPSNINCERSIICDTFCWRFSMQNLNLPLGV